VETLRTVDSLLKEVPQERVLFGSHTPFLQTRAAVMKLRAPYVPEPIQRAIAWENALSFLGEAMGD